MMDDGPMLPSPARRIWSLCVLLIVGVLAFLDKAIFVLCLVVIKEELALTDTQLGLLGGGTFALVISLFSIPFGVISDAISDRRVLLAGALFCWSVSMVLLGLPWNGFFSLLLFRAGVGIGETALVPTSVSLIHETFPAESRVRATALYAVIPFVGTGLAFLVAGLTLRFTRMLILGVFRGWGFLFVVFGSLGIFLPLLFATISEPRHLGPRRSLVMPKFDNAWKQWRIMVVFLLLVLSFGIMLSGWVAFQLPLYVSFGLSASQASLGLAVIDPLCGIAGVVGAGRVSEFLTARIGFGRASVWAIAVMTACSVTIAIARPFCTGFSAALAFHGLHTVSNSAIIGLSFTFSQGISPRESKSLFSGTVATVVNFGFFLGPLMVGALSDYFSGQLELALLVVACACAIPLLFGSLVFVRFGPAMIVDFNAPTDQSRASEILLNVFPEKERVEEFD